MDRYSAAGQLDIWYDLITADQLTALFKPAERELATSHISRKARQRTSAGAARKLTETLGGRLRITEDPPLRVRLGNGERGLADEVFEAYRTSLPEYRRHLLDRFTFVDAARQVVGVGSVGMRVFLVLLEGRDSADPFFLQIKQAGSSVYEAYCGESRHSNHGERVVVGKRLIQSATDIFAGWTTMAGNDFYVRQFRDMKVIPSGALIAPRLAEFATACGRVLARAHARTGDPIAIAAYIGKGRRFDDAVGGFAVSYADQTTRDHRALADAVRAAGRPESPETRTVVLSKVHVAASSDGERSPRVPARTASRSLSSIRSAFSTWTSREASGRFSVIRAPSAALPPSRNTSRLQAFGWRCGRFPLTEDEQSASAPSGCLR